MPTKRAANVFGQPLMTCSVSPRTGFYRDGCCNTGAEDAGMHLVCALMTDKFLAFSKSRGNDLSTPIPEYEFPGLQDGDFWCLCVLRWKEALQAGCAPKVKLSATHISALEFVELSDLQDHAVEEDDS